MRKFFRFLGNYLRSSPRVLLFELLFKLLVSALAIPVFFILTEWAIDSSGVGYLRYGNLPQFLMNPITILVIFLILLMIGFISLLEIASLTASAAYSYEHRRIGVFAMLECGINALLKGFRGRGIFGMTGLALNLAGIQIILYLGLIFEPTTNILERFLGIFAKPVFIAAAILLELLFAWLLAGRSYTIHYLVLTQNNYSKSVKKSREHLQGKRLKTALTLIIWAATALLFAAVVTFSVSFIIILGIRGFSRPEEALLPSLKVLSYAGKIVYTILAIITVPFLVSGLTSKFFEDNAPELSVSLPKPNEKKIPRPVKIGLGTVVFALGIFLNFSYIQAAYRGNVNLNAGIFTRTQVTAHRGFSYTAPENTLYAFQAAIDINSDYIELDVQQTKDGQLVIFHDDDMERITGIKGKIGDHTYDELRKISVGKWFEHKDKDFSDAEIMLLADLLELARESNTMLNIEIKKSGDPIDTANKTAGMLMEYDMEDVCYITSFERSALKAVKKIDPNIKTALISNGTTPLAFGKMDYIDGVSLNYLFVNKSIVRSFHMGGKRVFVWTVNNRADMDRMISMGVDNIITDRPDIAAKAVYSYDKGDMVLSVLESIFS